MKVNLPVENGNACLNVLRSVAYSGIPTVRPIGFKVGETSTVIGISDRVIEDMTTFISNVTSYQFVGSFSGLQEVTCKCEGSMTIAELLNGCGINAIGDVTVPILHSDYGVSVSIIFRCDAGFYTQEQNDELMYEKGYTGYAAINSRHTNLKAFTFKECDDGSYEVLVESEDGAQPQAILLSAISGLERILDNLKNSLKTNVE